MHILKLPWFAHKAENKLVECYSVSINADGSRLASGGLDGNVKIWDTHTVLQFKAIDDVDPTGKVDYDRLLPPVSQRRPLCSMSRHNGVVTSVKFSPDGRFLASGSDDKIVLIWEKDAAASGTQFGAEEQDLEHWTVRKRLVAHENDIQDICWSPDGLLLVTVGLDRSIIIWSGTTFERIKRYDIHQSMVKGIVFDPANKFFATASDDRTVRIFRYSKKLYELVNNYEFQMEHVVFDPFKKSPLTSYFRRMSWSPDGQNIAVPNATNGPVPSVAIIKRGNWSTDISLIGHEAPCEVCSFSPRLFEIEDDSKRADDRDFNTVLATGGQDRTLAIWSTYKSKPLVVAEDAAGSSITDICWDPSGQTLYFSSLDGYITCVSFDENELGKVVSPDLINTQLNKYGTDRDSTIFPESVDQLLLEEKAKEVITVHTERLSTSPAPKPQIKEPPKPTTDLASTPVQSLTPKQVNKLTQSITIKNGKKRVAPLLVSALSNSRSTLTNIPTPKITKNFKENAKVSHTSYFIPRSGITSAVRGMKKRVLDAAQNQILLNGDQDNDNDDMAIDLNETSNATNLSVSTLRKQKAKIRKQLLEARYPSSFKYVTNLSESLFNHSSLIQHEISQIVNLNDLENSVELFTGAGAIADTTDEDLIFGILVAGVQHYGKSMYETDTDYGKEVLTTIEVRNGPSWPKEGEEADLEYNDKVDFQDPTTVIVTDNLECTNRKYVLYYPFKIQHVLPIIIDGILLYHVLVSFDGTLQIIFAETGTSVCPSIELGENLILVKHNGCNILGVTSSGLLYVWKLPDFPFERLLKGHIRGVSMAPIMNSGVEISHASDSDNKRQNSNQVVIPNVKSIDVDESGNPLVILTTGNEVFKYNVDLMVWVKVVDPWYFRAVDVDVGKTGSDTFDHFRQLSASGFWEDVQRSITGRYVITPANKELEDVMKARYRELTSMT